MRQTQFISRDSSARHPDIGRPNPGTFEDLPAAAKSHTLGGGRRKSPGDGAVSKKISYLVREGKPQKQAVAIALSMKRAHRLTPSGGYKRVGR